LLFATGIVLAGLLGYGHIMRAFDWSEAWREQQVILKQAPIEGIQRVEPDAEIIFVNRGDIRGAPIFDADWDLSSAMPLTFGPPGVQHYFVYNPWLGNMSWDGLRLRYDGLEPVAATPDVYVWKPSDHQFTKEQQPFQIRQDLAIVSGVPVTRTKH
jgi:hypothetical protein